MANLLIVGNTLVHAEEYIEKKQLGEINNFTEAFKNEKPAEISFSGGTVTTGDIKEVFDKISEGTGTGAVPTPYTEIGLGKPVCVEILTIYTGDYPNGLFGG